MIDKQLSTLDTKPEIPDASNDDAADILSDPDMVAELDEATISAIKSETDAAKFLEMRAKLVEEQKSLKRNIRDEEEKLEGYTTYAARRQHDYSPFIRKMLGLLADKQVIQEYLQ